MCGITPPPPPCSFPQRYITLHAREQVTIPKRDMIPSTTADSGRRLAAIVVEYTTWAHRHLYLLAFSVLQRLSHSRALLWTSFALRARRNRRPGLFGLDFPVDVIHSHG